MSRNPETDKQYDPTSDLPTLRGPVEAAKFARSIGIDVGRDVLLAAMRAGELPFHRIGHKHDLAPVDVVNYLRGRRSVPREVEDQ